MQRDLFLAPALEVAPKLLGALLTVHTDEGAVSVRLTEVEAYHGVGTPAPYDPGSHARDRKTERNASMFGPPAHAYVYISYGVHFALNLVCSPEGIASGVLVRAGEVVQGHSLARSRRVAGSSAMRLSDRQLARGPGNLASALGITRNDHNGKDLFQLPFELSIADSPPLGIVNGPRVGVSGVAGSGAFPWRFWIDGDPTVSAYRPGRNVPTS